MEYVSSLHDYLVFLRILILGLKSVKDWLKVCDTNKNKIVSYCCAEVQMECVSSLYDYLVFFKILILGLKSVKDWLNVCDTNKNKIVS
jgi:hypothetical protein